MEENVLHSSSAIPSDLPLRINSLLLRAYPWFTGILAHRNLQTVFDSDSGFHTFVAQLERFEEKFYTSFSREAVGVRQLLHYNNEAIDTSAITEVNKQQMIELFVSYRILDLYAREKGVGGLLPVPSQLKNENLGIIGGIGWKHIEDWKRLLQKFQSLMGSMLQALPSETNTSHLATLRLLLSRNAGNKILLNIQIAAMHLADILGGVDYLENRPLLFLQKFIMNAPNSVSRADIDVIKGLIKAYKGNQLRLPLHVAVMISPLYLLFPIQLYSIKWDRQTMFLTSKGIGNSKPPLLLEVENQLLALLFRLARSERDLRTEMQEFSFWLEGKQPELINEAPDSRAWFKSDPSSTVFNTRTETMHLLGPSSPVFNVRPPLRLVGDIGDIFNGDSDSLEIESHKDKSQEDTNEEDKTDDDRQEDRMDENKMDMDIDDNGEDEEEDSQDEDKSEADRSKEDKPDDDRQEDRMDENKMDMDIDDNGKDEEDSQDEDKSEEDRSKEDKPDDDSEDEMKNGGNSLANSVDRHGGEREPDTRRHDGSETDGTIGNNQQPSENSAARSARCDVEGNDREEDNVQGRSSLAGEYNGKEDDAMEGGSIVGKDVEGNDVERDDIEMDMGIQASVAGEDIKGNGGVEDGVSGIDSKDYEMDALSSITEEDDDDRDCRKAEKKSEPKKEQKPPVRNLKRDRTKGWNDKAGLRKETAIDVDAFFHVEEITLEHEIIVKRYENIHPIPAYGPDEWKPIKFVTHSEEDTWRLLAFADAIEQGFVNNNLAEASQQVPLHFGNPEASIFRITSQSKFDKLSDKEILDTLASHCILVTDRPVHHMKFDAKGLSTLSTLSTVVPIQDQSRGLDNSGTSYQNRVLQGTLRQVLECSQIEEGHGGKILNALQFPMPEEGLGTNPFSTDSIAWCGTKGWQDCDEMVLPPTADIRWGLAATTGALHWWHIDSDGFGTYIDVKTGMKWWIVARPKDSTYLSHQDFTQFARTNIFMTSDYRMEEPCKSKWDLEAILLTPGTRLIMRPNQPHAVYTPEHAICHGGHFYAISTIQDTMAAFVHCFVSGNFVTNTEHSSSRLLLRRMAHFYHGAFVLGKIQKDDPGSDHVPDIEDFKSFLDVVTLCNLILLMNVLDGRTYQSGSISSEERLSSIYARGKCIDLLIWIDEKYRLREPSTENFDGTEKIESCSWMMMEYFLQQISAIRSYKQEAEKSGIQGSDSSQNCTAKQVSKELEMVRKIFPGLNKKHRLSCMTSSSLAWIGIKYHVECKHRSSSMKHEQSFEYYNQLGSTENDRIFLAHIAAQGEMTDSESDRPNKHRRTS